MTANRRDENAAGYRPVHGNINPRELRSLGLSVEELLDFSACISPIGPPEAIWQAMRSVDLSAYPDPECLELREAISRHLSFTSSILPIERILVGNGSTEIFHLLTRVFLSSNRAALLLTPTYGEYDGACRLAEAEILNLQADLFGDFRWDIDAATNIIIDKNPTLIFVCNPNNPTGSYVQSDELDAVRGIATHSELALISDEVFGSYPMDESFAYSSGPLVAEAEALTFTLGGLSKSAGLPQLKLGWIIVGGPDGLVRRALNRLEFICDSYLSVATPVQLAVGMLIDQTRPLADAIRRRVQMNYLFLCSLVRRFPVCQVLHIDAGWYAVIQVPAIRSEEALVVELIEQDQVLAHPGYFFDFPNEAFLVVSLLPEPGCFTEAVTKILKRASA